MRRILMLPCSVPNITEATNPCNRKGDSLANTNKGLLLPLIEKYPLALMVKSSSSSSVLISQPLVIVKVPLVIGSVPVKGTLNDLLFISLTKVEKPPTFRFKVSNHRKSCNTNNQSCSLHTKTYPIRKDSKID